MINNHLYQSLFMICTLLLYSLPSVAQLTIPSGNAFTSTSNRPMGAFYKYDNTISVYSASEMNITTGSTITGIRYFVQTTATPVNVPVSVYMRNNSSGGFSPAFYGATLVNLTNVFNGTILASDVTAGKWITIPLTTPFVYTGTNLHIMTSSYIGDGNGQGTNDKLFRWHNATSQSQIWFSNIAASYPAQGTVLNSKPNIQILYDTPGATGTLSFDYAASTMLENRNQVITVNRSGGSTGAVSVDYATSDGTAIAGTDYNATSGTLNWADGDMQPKTFTITTLPDFIVDDAETITLTLSNPVGATFNGPTTSTVTVTNVLPPLVGTYTVGAGGNYPSLTNTGGIFQAINQSVDGVSGPITINIISNLTGESGTHGLNEIIGNHAVLIRPFGGARTITGSSINSTALIRFTGTDNITIDGSTTGATVSSCLIGGDATLRELTLTNTSTNSGGAAIGFVSGTNGAKNNTVKNVTISGASSTGSGYGIYFGGVTSGSIGIDNDGNKVENCSVKKLRIGIASRGENLPNQNTGTIITQNDLSSTGTDKIAVNGIYINNEMNPIVSYNKVYVETTDTTSVSGLAIGVGSGINTTITSGGITGAMISNNIISGALSTNSIGNTASGIIISGASTGLPNTVQNNIIYNVSSQAKGGAIVAGIFVVGAVASVTKVYNNTVSLSGDRGSEALQYPSYCIALTGLDPSLEMKNNILSTTQIATGGGLVKTYAFGTASTTFDNLTSDYNAFYSGGVQDGGFRSGSLNTNAGTSYATLALWSAAIADDTQSVEVIPVFVSPTNLHLDASNNPLIAGAGTPIATVTTDIDCEIRNTLTPTIGADELNVSNFSITATAGANGTISPAGITVVGVGTNQTYTFTPNCGYTVQNVIVDGVAQGSLSSYTFTNVTANHTISVTFVGSSPIITAGGPTTFCDGGNVVLTSSSATGNLWSNGATTQSITVTTAGTYSVEVTNGSCTATSNGITITINPLPTTPTITASGATSFCDGGNVVLTSSAATGNVWSNGATTQSITVTTDGTYTVSVTSNGCTSGTSAPTTVTVNPIPATPTITASGTTTFCEGGNVVLTSSAAIGNVWSNGATTQSITVTTDGTYTVSVTSNGCTSGTSAPTTVTVNPIPVTPTITANGPTTFCEGGNVVLTSSAATGNVWSNGATTQSITVTTDGTYTVTVTSNGCTLVTSAPTAVTVNPIPATPTITASGPTTFCDGGNVVLTSSAATGNVWSNGATTQSITVTTDGTYTVAVTSNGCTSGTSAPTTVTVNQIPVTPTITASGPTTFCDGGNVVLTSSAATGNVWSNGATTQSITVTTDGTYTVAGTSNGCTSGTSAATTVTVNAIPTTPTITASGATTFCDGENVVLTSSAATGNVWSNGATTQSITVTTDGTYTVSVTSNGCSSGTSAPTMVTVNPIPVTPTITASGATTFCNGENVVLTSSAATGNVWSNGATTQSITVTTDGTYTVAVTSNGCTSGTSAATAVTVNPIPATPTITASGATTFCDGENVVLTSSAATGNVWSNGATTQSITVTTDGTYTVAVTSNGCTSGTAATTVTVNPSPSNEVTQNAGIVTANQSAASYQWYQCPNTLIDGANNQTYIPTEVGDYKVEITLGNCVVTSDCITVSTLGNTNFAPSANFHFYPNPVTSILHIENDSPLGNVEVFNVIGQKVLNRTLYTNAAQIDLDRFSAGTYLVRVTSESTVQVFKIIKN